MKKLKWIVWTAVALVVAAGIWYWQYRSGKTEIVLETVHAETGTISNSVTATGTVQPVDTVSVGSQVSGIIQKVYVDFNTPVRKGQLLAQLDKSLLQAQVDQFGANLMSAKANVTFQKSNYERQQQLYNIGAVSKADLESALYQYKASQETVNSINAQLESARKNLSFADIYSPIDGTVLARSVSEGQTVAASLNTPQLFSIAKDLTKMQVQASVDEADIGNVRSGQRVIFTVDAFPADTFSGHVKEVRLRSNVSANVVTYTTIIDAPNESLKLKPGMTASITIYTREVSNILIVPARALQFNPDSVVAAKYPVERRPGSGRARDESPPAMADNDSALKGKPGILWIKQGEKLVRRPVVTGISDETQVQIVSGITAAEEIVTGYEEVKSEKKKAGAKSPFMPTRPSGNRRNQGGPPQ